MAVAQARLRAVTMMNRFTLMLHVTCTIRLKVVLFHPVGEYHMILSLIVIYQVVKLRYLLSLGL